MKKYVLATTALMFAACATQDPAPVLSGQSRLPWEPKFSQVETPIALESQVRQQQALKQAGDSYSLTNRIQAQQTQQLAAATPTSSLARTISAPTFQQQELGAIEPAAGPQKALTNTQLFASPAITAAPVVAATPVVTAATPRVATHEVSKGDTMYSLSRKHGTTVAGLMAANNKTSPSLSVGEIILVPNTLVATATPVKTAPVVAAAPQVAPQGYSLTRKATAQPQLAAIQRVSAIEPAAGPQKTVAKLPVKVNTSTRTHQVQAGETLYRIGKTYGVTPIDLMAANNFQKPQDLIAGTRINIPVVGGSAAIAQNPTLTADINQQLAKAKGFVWPAEGKILASYGQQGTGITHTGINIAVPENTPVRAAESGTVIYADDGLKSYGNLVLIRHADGLVTAYGHNNQLVAKKDAKVQKGQTIALSGKTGNVTTPQLHFEVRRNAQAINPLSVLPKSAIASR